MQFIVVTNVQWYKFWTINGFGTFREHRETYLEDQWNGICRVERQTKDDYSSADEKAGQLRPIQVALLLDSVVMKMCCTDMKSCQYHDIVELADSVALRWNSKSYESAEEVPDSLKSKS